MGQKIGRLATHRPKRVLLRLSPLSLGFLAETFFWPFDWRQEGFNTSCPPLPLTTPSSPSHSHPQTPDHQALWPSALECYIAGALPRRRDLNDCTGGACFDATIPRLCFC